MVKRFEIYMFNLEKIAPMRQKIRVPALSSRLMK